MRKLLYATLLGMFSVNAYGASDSHKSSGHEAKKDNGHHVSNKHDFGHKSSSNHGAFSNSSVHWGYSGTDGPARWGDLTSDFSLCKEGKNQSPIDFVATADRDLDPIKFHYSASPVSAINNGNSMRMNYAPGSYIEIGARQYELKQFRFHTPSEHTVNGEALDMEMHLVHESSDGRLAIVGVLMKEGKANSKFADLWRILPSEVNQEVYASGKHLNADDLLPENRAYFHYRGSLTTPPCSEGVNWFVMQEPITISRSAIQDFYAIVGENARPVQSMHTRIPMRFDK